MENSILSVVTIRVSVMRWVRLDKLRNPITEIREKPEIRKSNDKANHIRDSDFFRISDLGIRIWFGYLVSCVRRARQAAHRNKAHSSTFPLAVWRSGALICRALLRRVQRFSNE